MNLPRNSLVTAFGLGLLCLQLSCTRVTPIERFRDLSDEGRKEFLEEYPRARFQQLRKQPISKLAKNAQGLPKLEITSSQPTRIERGERADFKATAIYPNGFRVDVTEDVGWSVTPRLLQMSGASLQYGCINSDVWVNANFFDVAENTFQFQIRKKLTGLKIEVSESNQAVEESEYIQLDLFAECSDGSRQLVSCQAHWEIAASAASSPENDLHAEILSCGQLHVRPHSSFSSEQENQLTIQAEYGLKKVIQRMTLPPRLFYKSKK